MSVTKTIVRREGNRVFINIGDHTFLELQWQAALEFGQAIIAISRQVEEIEKAEQVAFDGALMLRSGAPFGLAFNPKIQEMTKVEMIHNPTLRSAMSGMGIKQSAILGVPRLLMGPPKDKPK